MQRKKLYLIIGPPQDTDAFWVCKDVPLALLERKVDTYFGTSKKGNVNTYFGIEGIQSIAANESIQMYEKQQIEDARK